ncbi:hypothetical protein LCS82_08545 [Vibrio harveyi]
MKKYFLIIGSIISALAGLFLNSHVETLPQSSELYQLSATLLLPILIVVTPIVLVFCAFRDSIKANLCKPE